MIVIVSMGLNMSIQNYEFTHHTEIPISLLKELVRLDSASGKLYWKPRTADKFKSGGWNPPQISCKIWNTKNAGEEAFSVLSTGYFHGSLFDIKIRAHIVVYALYHNKWPEQTIDHIDGDRLNNRPINLRDVKHSHNIQNQTKPLPNNKLGVRGVVKTPSGRYTSQMRAEKVIYNLGTYDSVEEAKQAYLSAKAKYQNCPVTKEHCKHGLEITNG